MKIIIEFLRKVRRKILLAVMKAFFGEERRVLRNISLEGFEIIAPVNEVLGRQFIALREYEKEETEFLRANVRPNDICFDVGGNVGYFSLLLSGLAKKGIVHTFEPIKGNSTLIEASAALNGIKNIIVNNTAVGDQNGHVEFSVSQDTAYSSIINTDRVPEKMRVTVPIISLDEYIKKNQLSKIDILKIDVEGAEAQVLKGAQNLLKNSTNRPRIILIELFDDNLLGFNTSSKEITDTFLELGYTANIITNRAGKFIEHRLGENSKEYNFVFLSSETHNNEEFSHAS